MAGILSRGSSAYDAAAQRAGQVRSLVSHGGPQTAIVLIFAILFVRLTLNGGAGGVWSALWGPVKPLGQANMTVTEHLLPLKGKP